MVATARRDTMRPLALVAAVLACAGCIAVDMPGHSFRGPLPALDPSEISTREHLERHVGILAEQIGTRNVFRPAALESAADHIEGTWQALRYRVLTQSFAIDSSTGLAPSAVHGRSVKNLEIELTGTTHPEEIIVIGAHYDTATETPGADDNASGVAAILELARLFADVETGRTLRFVAFVNEEPPFFGSENMGSCRYAARSRERNERIIAMFSIEMIGFYSSERASQEQVVGSRRFYPSVGNFIVFVGDVASRELVSSAVKLFRAAAKFPSEGLSGPAFLPGVALSDQLCFWANDYPGIMVTDTAYLRNPNYHEPTDTPDTLDYDRMARVVLGLRTAIAHLALVRE